MELETRGWAAGGRVAPFSNWISCFVFGLFFFVVDWNAGACVSVWPQIYTDWANHYLAKSGHKRLIKDLQTDVTDGVLLAEIIQVVGKTKTKFITIFVKKKNLKCQLWSHGCLNTSESLQGLFYINNFPKHIKIVSFTLIIWHYIIKLCAREAEFVYFALFTAQLDQIFSVGCWLNQVQTQL